MSLRDGFVPGEASAVPPIGSGRLDGLRFAVKDLIDLAGQRTGGGNPDWLAASTPAGRHARVVAALLAEGATCIGKTITDELAFSLEGENTHYGTPINPANAGWLPGGSSSGSAVAVASGKVDFALGTDTGGSVRVPAAFCRIFGFRPTHGALSLDGVLPFSPSYDTVGWFARDATILAQAGDVLLPLSQSEVITDIRLAGDVLAQVGGAVAEDIAEAANGMVTGEPVDILGDLSLSDLQRAYTTVQGYEIKLALGEKLRRLHPRLGTAIAARFAGVMAITSEQYADAGRARARMAAHVAAACPLGRAIALPTVSLRYLNRQGGDNLGEFYANTLGLTAIAGHGGLPQVQLGIALAGDRIGMALLSAPHADRALLELARKHEERSK